VPQITSETLTMNPGGWQFTVNASAPPGAYAVETASTPQGPWVAQSTVRASGGTLQGSAEFDGVAGFVKLGLTGT